MKRDHTRPDLLNFSDEIIDLLIAASQFQLEDKPTDEEIVKHFDNADELTPEQQEITDVAFGGVLKSIGRDSASSQTDSGVGSRSTVCSEQNSVSIRLVQRSQEPPSPNGCGRSALHGNNGEPRRGEVAVSPWGDRAVLKMAVLVFLLGAVTYLGAWILTSSRDVDRAEALDEKESAAQEETVDLGLDLLPENSMRPQIDEDDPVMISVNDNDDAGRVWRLKAPGKVVQTEIVDFQRDGTNKVLAAIGGEDLNPAGGLLVSYNADKSKAWEFSVNLLPNYGLQKPLFCRAFWNGEVTGSVGRETVLLVESYDSDISALCVISANGDSLLNYWHPGNILDRGKRFDRENIYVRGGRSSVTPLIIGAAVNNDLREEFAEPDSSGDLYAFFAIDPTKGGESEAPPWRGRVGRENDATAWYYVVEPVGTKIGRIMIDDGDPENQFIRVSVGDHPTKEIHKFFYINFDGEIVGEGRGDGHLDKCTLTPIKHYEL